MEKVGKESYQLCKDLFPICRSITGNGVRKTLEIIRKYLPDLKTFEVPTGTKAYDWTVPKEWNITDAYIIGPDGNKIVDFKESNLHVVGYSVPVDKTIPLVELQKHLYSIPEQPDAIPYVTSYYQERWGFCISEKQRAKLKPGNYHVYINSSLKAGRLTYGELIIKGKTNKEILISTYICHPSMANNELSGPAVTTYLAKWIATLVNRQYTYRIVFIPETIGSIIYLSKNLRQMKKNVIAGFNLTCIGDNRSYSLLQSRYGNTYADRVALHVLENLHPDFKKYSYLDRGSDERQYCSPGIDLPVVSVMRTKYGMYPEYHTSLDNLELISPEGLYGGYEVMQRCIECIEKNEFLTATVLCEPQLGKRGLYPTLSKKGNAGNTREMLNLLAYCDGTNDIIDLAELIGKPVWELYELINTLKDHKLLNANKGFRSMLMKNEVNH